jgi:hypothetical protein
MGAHFRNCATWLEPEAQEGYDEVLPMLGGPKTGVGG